MCAKGLAKLIEECGELMQVAGKRLAMWDQDIHWDGTVLDVRLSEELGDVIAAAWFVARKFDIYQDVIERNMAKKALFATWEADQQNNDHGIDTPLGRIW